MQKLFVSMFVDSTFEKRIQDRTDYLQAGARAVQIAETLHTEITQSERDLAITYRARWQAIGSSALSGVFMLLGAMLVWVVFDRELRRLAKAKERLAVSETHFRSLVEHQLDPLAVLDGSGNMQYVNPAWHSRFNYELEDLAGRNLFEMIHPDDRARVQMAVQTYDVLGTTKCRLSADYGVWHDVEMQCQEHDDEKTALVRFHDVLASLPRRDTEPGSGGPVADQGCADAGVSLRHGPTDVYERL